MFGPDSRPTTAVLCIVFAVTLPAVQVNILHPELFPVRLSRVVLNEIKILELVVYLFIYLFNGAVSCLDFSDQ
jgi:hypothetical protein